MLRAPKPRVDQRMVKEFAALIKKLPAPAPLNFYSFTGADGKEIVASDMYPPKDAPWAIDLFFLVCLHQYGFWHDDGEHYMGPLVGKFRGKDAKGSDLLWKLFRKAAEKDPDVLTPRRLAEISEGEWRTIMSDYRGPVDLLVTEERIKLTRAYGRYWAYSCLSDSEPRGLVDHSNKTASPLATFLSALTDREFGVPGFKEDPLKKKALLLVMALVNRPEKFMVPEKDFVWDPIVDYHLMRLALRIGLVTLPNDWHGPNIDRRLISPAREAEVRKAVYRALKKVIVLSGRTMAEVDVLLWFGRKFCPEMSMPDCDQCTFNYVCAKRVEFFQPVFRTTYY